jgi:EAL domain-containing protein (putative c-di-GMP-specific phosphodiesterase class I)
MYRAKAKGRTCFALFDQEMHASVVKLMHVKNDLWRAFRRSEFRVRYQPILSAATNQLVGFEALIRWQKDGREIVPDEFIRVAEESGQIIEIDRWVLRQVCRQIRAWSQSFPHRRSLAVSVNISGKHLRQADFTGFIQHTLFETGADPGQLILEVTESSYLENPEQIGAKLMELKSRGLRLHIDDFGVGYSSFSYLCKLPADAIKIDRAFISALEPGSEGLEVVRAMVAVARSLNMDAVAEGVETAQQAALATELGCGYLQGFFFSRPLRVEAVEKLLTEGMLPRDAVEPAIEAAV